MLMMDRMTSTVFTIQIYQERITKKTVSSFIVQHQVYHLIDSNIVKIIFTCNQQHLVNISTCQLYTGNHR